jgi:hypothetical protein
VLVLGPQRARQLVVAVRLELLALFLQRPSEPVVGVVVGRRELEHGPEFPLGFVIALDPQVRDPERLADRRLLRLAPLGLLEGHGRLGGPPLLQVGPSLLVEVVGLAHVDRR